jgi:hypothetical protein
MVASHKVFDPVLYPSYQSSVRYPNIGGEQTKMKMCAGPLSGLSKHASRYRIELDVANKVRLAILIGAEK